MMELYVILGLAIVTVVEFILLRTAKKRFIKKHVVVIEDDKPATDTIQARALQLSNELSKYAETEDNKIKLKVYKD